MSAWVSGLISGFIAGLLAGLFAEGARRMLAPIIMPHKIHIGKIWCAWPDRNFPYWCVTIWVKANPLWNLLISNIEDTRASLEFTDKVTGEKKIYLATWAGIGTDDLSATLRIGGEYELKIATSAWGRLTADASLDMKDCLGGDYDLSIILWNGKKCLKRWQYTKAILQGKMQEIEPDGKCVKEAHSAKESEQD